MNQAEKAPTVPILLLDLPEKHKFELMLVPQPWSWCIHDEFHNWPNAGFTPESRANWYRFNSLLSRAGRGGDPPTPSILTITQTLQSLLK